jgi:IS1 family transposase
VHRWLEKACAWCRRFNDRKIRRLSLAELQADEIQTIVGGKERPIWIFVVLDVWSRLWPSTLVGKRSYRNTLDLFRDVSNRMILPLVPLITTDGFKFYERVIGRVFGPACVYGQVIKTRRKDRVVKVDRRALIGAGRLQQALRDSEDSVKLNTSFVERVNLTIRQGSAYLGRRTICQARRRECLEDHIELFRCYYNFIRPHRALKFGREVRTPAMQAGLAKGQLRLRDIFSSTMFLLIPKHVIFVFFKSARPVTFTARRMALAA